MKVHFLSNKKLTIILHVLAWSIIIFIPRYLVNTYGGGRDNHFLYQFYTNTFIYGSFFYLNYLWLVPHCFFRENKLHYILTIAAAISILCIVLWFVNEHVFYNAEQAKRVEKIIQELNKDKTIEKPPFKEFRLYNYFYTSILICGFSLGLGILEKLGQNEKERKELEKEKLNSELAFLKNQISPHFFFNTLNNIYSLISIDTEEARSAVLRLSKLMRYLIYESERGESKLSDEIDFLNHYIDLMKLRLSNKVKLAISFPVSYRDLYIPPLLFIPFIENAFKHGVSYREPSFIDIQMKVEGSKILFSTKNSIGPGLQAKKGNHSGIGLENVKKRLNLLFPKSHTLTINRHAGAFIAELSLDTQMQQK